MNLIRTIQATESQAWVDLLFQQGPHIGSWVPMYPHRLPFPCRLRQGLVGNRLYIVYKRSIVGYGNIDQVVQRQASMPVGSKGQPVSSGDTVMLSGVCTHMPSGLKQVEVRGFMGPRYTNQDLQTLNQSALRAALKTAHVTVY